MASKYLSKIFEKVYDFVLPETVTATDEFKAMYSTEIKIINDKLRNGKDATGDTFKLYKQYSQFIKNEKIKENNLFYKKTDNLLIPVVVGGVVGTSLLGGLALGRVITVNESKK